MVLALTMSLGCRSDSAPPAAFTVRIEALEGVEPGESDAVREAFDHALGRSSHLRPSSAEGTEIAARMRVSEIRTPSGAVLRVDVDLEEPTSLDAQLGTGLDATVEVERRDGTLVLQRDLPHALDRAVAVLDAKVILARDQTAEVATVLGDDDPQIVVLALEHVTRKRQREHIDSVLPLLRHPEPEVARAAVESVGRIGGPEHVPALVEAAHLADPRHTSELYEALAMLGGPEAIGFLSFASANEDDPDLAEVARRALIVAQRGGATTGLQEDVTRLRGHR